MTVQVFSSCSKWGLFSSCGVRASHCGGFPCGALALGVQGAVAVARGLRSCGAQALLLCSVRDLPGPGIELVSPALQGRFLTTGTPGKPRLFKLVNTLKYFLVLISSMVNIYSCNPHKSSLESIIYSMKECGDQV